MTYLIIGGVIASAMWTFLLAAQLVHRTEDDLELALIVGGLLSLLGPLPIPALLWWRARLREAGEP